MNSIENSVATQRHMHKLLSAAQQPVRSHRYRMHKRIEPGFDGTEAESWEETIYIEAIYKHRFPLDMLEMPPNERPTDINVIERDYSMLRVSSGSRVVMELVWNGNGWFGHIDPGAWEVTFVKWTICWWQCEDDDVVPAA